MVAGLLLCGLALLLPGTARATSARELGLDEMVSAADDIVVGEVLSSEARWQGKLIVTDSVVRVDEALKGGGAATVTVTQLGGTAVHPVIGAPVTMDVSSYVGLQPGERVLLFLEQKRPGMRQIVGAEQGKFVVRDDADTQAAALPVGPKRLRVERGPGHDTVLPRSMPLDVMRSRIQALLAGSAATPGAKP